MLSCSYAILVSHFVYRYLVIQSSKYTNTRFPHFMAGSFGLCIVYFLFFAWICECWMYAPDYLKEYFREDFIKEYGSDPKNFNMFTGIYNEANSEDIIRTWCGVIMLVILSGGSISVYFFFGHRIMKKLNEAGALATMSQDTATLQRKLLKALTVQTIIPICISFAPSVVVWLSPVFNVSMGRIYNHTGTIALSAFPFFDPVAIIFFLPVLRHRLYKAKPSEIPTRSVSVTMTTLHIP
ncbi:unnamed protein product [Caenorhabditis brenneri]